MIITSHQRWYQPHKDGSLFFLPYLHNPQTQNPVCDDVFRGGESSTLVRWTPPVPPPTRTGGTRKGTEGQPERPSGTAATRTRHMFFRLTAASIIPGCECLLHRILGPYQWLHTRSDRREGVGGQDFAKGGWKGWKFFPVERRE
ncbi:hypothetical protein CDAR_495611 [Caerostris darwini]|uniref:Uncharacterized protein n=1 Tax=Caerostris darwini TaxID=1538125 RepID=A0AAV4SCH5_9ARAC|nr:hypothetical protein CDAR_495611 [Caerostris darwini]